MLFQELRFAARSLAKRPGYTAIIIATLALGIGANAGIFSVVNGVLLEPLPYPEPEQVVHLLGTTDGEIKDRPTIAYLDFADWRRLSRSFAAASAYDEWGPNLTGDGEPLRLEAAQVNPGFFGLLGARPAAGRFFRPEEDVDGQDRVVVLSHGLWQSRYGGDPTVVGSTVILDGNPYEVVGVAPKDFVDPRLSGLDDVPPQLWRPLGYLGVEEARLPNRGSSSYTAIARLRPGVSLAQAQAELDVLAGLLEEEYPDTNRGRGVAVVPLHDSLVGGSRHSLLLLLAAVGFVLAIACANVASVMLGRVTERRGETALRRALGASGLQLGRALLWESLLLATAGGALGLLLAQGTLQALLWSGGGGLPLVERVALDARVLAFSTLLTLVVAGTCALLPAWASARADLGTALRDGLKTGSPRSALRPAIIVAEVALSVLLLAGAGLLLTSFWNLHRVDPGLDPEGVLTFRLAPSYGEEARHTAFYGDLLQRLEQLPGVEAAGAINILPLSGSFDGNSVTADDRPLPPPHRRFSAQVRSASPGYRKAMGLQLVEGRFLEPADRDGAPLVAVVNESLARHFWPEASPISRRITVGRRSLEVVGMVTDVKHLELAEAGPPRVYLSRDQGVLPWQTQRMSVVLRAGASPADLMPQVREVVRGLDPNLPIYGVHSMGDLLSTNLDGARFRTLLVAAFAALALLLAAVGVYGVLSYSVAQRKLEIAVRLAIGARRRSVEGLVLRQGMKWVAAGVALGLGAAVVVTRWLEGLLFQVSPTDPGALAAVCAVLFAAAAAACYLPARRASAVDPMQLIRS